MIEWRKVPDVDRGLLLAPLAPVIIAAFGITTITDHAAAWPGLIMLGFLYGLPIAYGVMLLVGAPTILLLDKCDRLTPVTALLASVAGGIAIGVPFALTSDSVLGALPTALAGLLTGIAFVLVAWSPRYTGPAAS